MPDKRGSRRQRRWPERVAATVLAVSLIVLTGSAAHAFVTGHAGAAVGAGGTETVADVSAENDLMSRLDSEDQVQRLEALKEIASRVEVGESMTSEMVRAIVDRLSDNDINVSKEAEKVLELIGEPALVELAKGLERYSGARGITTRQSIARLMGKMGPDAVEYLLPLLNDSSVYVRKAVAASLELMGEHASPAREKLIRMVMDVREDADVRAAAVSALASTGASDEASLLAFLFARVDANFRIAFAANTALMDLAPPTEVLIAVLMDVIDDPGLEVSAREALAWTAGQARDFGAAALSYYRESGVSDRASFVRELQHLYSTLDSVNKTGVVGVLAQALRDGEAEVRDAALGAVSTLDELAKDLVPVLSSIALDAGLDSETRRAAMSGWAHIGVSTPDVAAQLIELAVAADEDIRRSAVSILAAVEQPSKSVADMILDNVQSLSEESNWRLAPVVVEVSRADSSVVDRLAAILQASEIGSFERLFAIRILSAIGNNARPSVPALVTALESEDCASCRPVHRRAIARALVQIGGEQAEEALGRLVDDPDIDVRRIARTALGLPFEVPGETVAVPAFPGAEGFGMWTVGGRGGKVYVVTNLSDSGPGSLREAVEASGPRIVVFAVSGTIHLKSRLTITNPYITIAGQTAPGDGITIADYDVVIRADEVILRHVRIRLGDRTRQEADALWIDGAKNVIVDHVSTSWSVDECLSVSASDNVTVQWCFITESLLHSFHSKGAHGYGSLVRGEFGSKYSFHHNLWAHHSGRMPRPGNYTAFSIDKQGALMDFRNNVFYNWGRGYAGANHDTNSITRYNFINNYYKRGPNSTGSIAFREECPYAGAHFSGNMMNGVEPADPWSLVDARINKSVYEDQYKQSDPYPVAAVRTESADVAYERVLLEAGAHPRDNVDARIAGEVASGRGRIINSQNEVGGWPVLRSEAPARDSNDDGVPDWWNVKYGFDPLVGLEVNGDLDGDGYTNIEEYLNGTDPDQYGD
ncbi:MAG: HEAT repeat domain-containing protein [Bacillota bacterium]|jgi:HEAT repeat protein|nr:hypothetical protein [Bacillota bacterium]HOB92226.1 HEAT repeat domain-containing protein [Bacillota bacterium]